MFALHQMAPPAAVHIAFWAKPRQHHHKYFPRGSSISIHSRETSPGRGGAQREAKRFWRIPIITSVFCATANQETRRENGEGQRWVWGGRAKRVWGKGFKEMIQIMAQRRSCCWTPRKHYSRRNSTWPGGKSPLPSAGLLLAQSGHGPVWCPPPIRLVCSLLSHSKVI